MAKAAFNKTTPFLQHIGLKFEEESCLSSTFGSWLCVVLKLGHLGK